MPLDGASYIRTDLPVLAAWANNGDQISKLYAGTSALKGDFTRTGKRDLHGMASPEWIRDAHHSIH